MDDLPGALSATSDDRARPRVLVVDDSDVICQIVRRMLTRHGYEVTSVCDGHAALEAASDRVDVVLLDLTMPGLNGLEVCRHLRAGAETATVPIVAMTGRTEPRDVRAARLAGANDYLAKPFEERELLAVLRRVGRTA
jgi:DNA-binding response OmpR family regulator